MKRFITTFQAIDKTDGHLKMFVGQNIFAKDENEAKIIIEINFPYLCVIGELIKEIDEFTGKEIKLQAN